MYIAPPPELPALCTPLPVRFTVPPRLLNVTVASLSGVPLALTVAIAPPRAKLPAPVLTAELFKKLALPLKVMLFRPFTSISLPGPLIAPP